MSEASDSRYAPIVHWTSAAEASNSRPIAGSATVTDV
jgi:hypothetical protein